MRFFKKHRIPWEITQSFLAMGNDWKVRDADMGHICTCETFEMAQFIIEACMLRQGEPE